jgi:hypothetical protein
MNDATQEMVNMVVNMKNSMANQESHEKDEHEMMVATLVHHLESMACEGVVAPDPPAPASSPPPQTATPLLGFATICRRERSYAYCGRMFMKTKIVLTLFDTRLRTAEDQMTEKPIWSH